VCIFALILALAAAFGGAGQALAQIAPGQRLTKEMVRQELERRLAAAPKNEAVIWNAGYDFFRHYPKNQDTAKAIREGFLTARTNDPAQKKILMKGADYWGKIHDYGIANVPAGQNFSASGNIYRDRSNNRADRSRMRRPGSEHKGFPAYDWPGRNIKRPQPRYGQDNNPHPGKYYTGMYPP
ncbi:hypothetical protein LJB99_06165, partial [Deltaproteobacteria bacterium OttesenSCG-928-K17]|nr:hypothetical protein [Deltaproteobacteria bacterium OttesenSCG-928-K17]